MVNFWSVITGFDLAMLLTFSVAAWLLIITPGADFVFISASGIAGGPRVGMAAATGVSAGVIVTIAIAAAGVSALVLANPNSITFIRYFGVAYLSFLAVQMWRSDGGLTSGAAAPGVARALQSGFLTNVLNPKTILFIFAFLPQFTDPAIGPVWMQILILGGIFLIQGYLFTMCLGAAAGFFADALRARVRFLNKVSAILFGGLAVRLIID
ncbi:MAG: LysE family translocator [Planktomarina sp.]